VAPFVASSWSAVRAAVAAAGAILGAGTARPDGVDVRLTYRGPRPPTKRMALFSRIDSVTCSGVAQLATPDAARAYSTFE
jgi:hypothetical protein